MKRVCFLSALLGALSFDSLANAALIEEFLFNEPMSSPLTSAVNSVPGGHAWADDLQGDLAGTSINGSGQYSLAAKTNNELGTALVNNAPDITTGMIYGVMELTWDFDPASLNTAENEEIRLTIINLNTAGSSSVTGEFAIIRQDNNTVDFSGVAVGTGSSNIAASPLSMTQSTKFIGVVGVNLDSNIYSVYFSNDAGASFTSLIGGAIDPARIGAQIRMVLNNDLSQDDVLIDRVALYTHNPYQGLILGVPEPSSVALVILSSLAILGSRRRN
jgi:hypothetical protein